MSQDIQNTVVIKGLPAAWSEESIKGVFNQFGPVENISYPVRPKKAKTNANKTITAFIRFANQDGVNKALATPKFDFNDPTNGISGQFTVAPYQEKPASAKKAAPAPKAEKKAAVVVEKKPVAEKKKAKKAPKPLDPTVTVVAKGLPFSFKQAQVVQTFESFGPVAKVLRIRRVAFVVFKDAATAEKTAQTKEFEVKEGEKSYRLTVDAYEQREPKEKKAPVEKKAAAPKAEKKAVAPKAEKKVVAEKKTTKKKVEKKVKVAESPNTVVYKSIPQAFTAEQVQEFAAKFGAVQNVRFSITRRAAEPPAFKTAFVTYADDAAAKAALAANAVQQGDVEIPIVEFSATPPTAKRIVLAKIPLTLDEAQVKALVEQYGEIDVFQFFVAKPQEGAEEIKREFQTAMIGFTSVDAAKAAIAQKSIAVGEQAVTVRPYRRFRFPFTKRAAKAL